MELQRIETFRLHDPGVPTLSSGVAVAAVCDDRDLMGEVGLAEGVSSVALLVSK
jgi:hypothetical protein